MRAPFEFDGDRLRRMTAVAVVALVAASLAGPAGAQTSNATPVDSCTTIDTPGNYVLTGDITGSGIGEEEACLTITASDVVLDGGGHTLTGGGSGHGVETDGTTGSVSNVTVENVHAENWTVGVFTRGATDGTIRNTVTNDTISGVALAASSGNRIIANTAYDNAIGLAVGGDSHNNTIRGETAVENKWGIHFERESGANTVRSSVARNNSNWEYYSTRNDAPNTVTGLELPTATVSFAERNVALREAPSPPPLPSDTGNLDSYIEATDTAGGRASLSLTMQYDPSNGAAASLWRTTGGGWAPVSGTETDRGSNAVSADNLTRFGTFGALATRGSGGPVTVTTARPPSVDRTLTTTRPTTARPATSNPTSGAGTAVATSNATTDTGPRAGSATATDTAGSARRPATRTASPTASSNGTEPTATGGVGGESEAAGLLSTVGGVRLLFAALGLVALGGLGLVVFRRRRDRGPGGRI